MTGKLLVVLPVAHWFATKNCACAQTTRWMALVFGAHAEMRSGTFRMLIFLGIFSGFICSWFDSLASLVAFLVFAMIVFAARVFPRSEDSRFEVRRTRSVILTFHTRPDLLVQTGGGFGTGLLFYGTLRAYNLAALDFAFQKPR